jgi:large subunit ribosomal protein L20
MTRIKRGNVSRQRHKKILKVTQGFRGSSATLFRTANQQALKALRFSYRDRHQRKRHFRTLWISRISAAVRENGFAYSKFVHKLKESKIELNRKMLAQLAIQDYQAFQKMVQVCLVPTL